MGSGQPVLLGIHEEQSCRIYMFAVYEFGHQVRTILHLFVNLINRRVLQFGIQFQVFEIRATAYTSELVEFHHVREVEAHHSAAIKYVIAHSGYAGRNGDSGELGAIHECMLGENRRC